MNTHPRPNPEHRSQPKAPHHKGATRLRYGVVAGLIGRATSTLFNVLLMPFYLRNLGVEVIGLIGFYTSILGVLLIVDHVLGIFVTREVATCHRRPGGHDQIRDLSLTAELLYFAVGSIAASAITLGAPLIAHGWLHSQVFTSHTVVICLLLSALSIPLQLLFNIHISILTGLELQIEANALMIFLGAGRGLLAVALIIGVSATPEAYFEAQLVALAACMLASAALAWRRLPHGTRRVRFRPSILAESWKFNSFLAANAIVFVIVAQSDKIMVSGLLSLSTFGDYVLAGTIASLPTLIVSPILAVLLPRFARLFETREITEMGGLFHIASQLVSLGVFPVWAVATFFPDALVYLWTGNPVTAQHVATILPFLISGTVLLSLNCVPNALALASRRPQYPFYSNAIALLGLPIGYWLIQIYGPAGATSIWIILGLLNVTLAPYLLHRHILQNALGRWFAIDTALPLLASGTFALLGRMVLPSPTGRVETFLELSIVGAAAFAASLLVAPSLRIETWTVTRKALKLLSTQSPWNPNR